MFEKKIHSEEMWELIERYLNEDLSSEELAQFSQRLSEDKELQQEVALHRAVHQTLGSRQEMRFRQTLRDASSAHHKAANSHSETPVRQLWRIASIAAVVLVTVGVFWFVNKSDGANEAGSFEPYAMILSERATSGTSDAAAINAAIASYQNADYTEAAAEFTLLAEADESALSYLFYAGVANLGAENCDQAVTQLSDLVETPGHLLIEQSRWYLALALVKCDRSGEAMEILDTIQPGHYKYDEAKDLVKRL